MIRRIIIRGIACLSLALIQIGCSDDITRATQYRVEAINLSAQRAEKEARLASARPDSATLLRLRDRYLAARDVVPPKLLAPSSGASDSLRIRLARALAAVELHAAQLALEARRPDLSLEQARWLLKNAAGDSATMRQAEYVVVGALRAQGKLPEALAAMRRMLRVYPPHPPERPGLEDPMLVMPLVIVEMRRQMGDQEAAAQELEAATTHYRWLLERPQPPLLEAQIRGRLIRTLLEQREQERALGEIELLERLVAAQPSLKSMEPDVQFARAMVRAQTGVDRMEVVAELQRFATNHPKHSSSARALLEAATILERSNQLARARDGYKAIVDRWGTDIEVAPTAVYRQAVMEDRLGRWDLAKPLFESIPVRYPRTLASAEAPIAIAQRYARHGDKSGARAAVQKAITVYRDLVKADSTAPINVVYRANLLRCHVTLADWEVALSVVDEMMQKDPGHPYTAQALLEGARIARANKFPDRSAAYLRRYLKDFPKSPLTDRVKAELKAVSL